jgi:two-component system, LytTR family, sensor kinase
MAPASKIGGRNWIRHILIWAIVWVLVSGTTSLYDGNFGRDFISFLLQMPLIVGSGYLLFYIIIPDFWLKGNRISGGLLILLIYLIVGFGNRSVMAWIIYPWLYENDHTFYFFNWYRIASQMLFVWLSHAFFASMKFYFDWDHSRRDAEELKNQKSQAELAFLRAQVHPHFLFNTLNALYGDIIQKKEAAGEILLKLTGIYRFMLEECREDMIPLSKELELIRNYIDLEKKRYGARLRVEFENELNSNVNIQVPPMILFSFIENSFKHGVSSQRGDNFVEILIHQKDQKLFFEVRNSIFEKQENLNGFQFGIGLENAQRQLELLYEKDFSLEQSQDKRSFTTELSLPLLDK